MRALVNVYNRAPPALNARRVRVQRRKVRWRSRTVRRAFQKTPPGSGRTTRSPFPYIGTSHITYAVPEARRVGATPLALSNGVAST